MFNHCNHIKENRYLILTFISDNLDSYFNDELTTAFTTVSQLAPIGKSNIYHFSNPPTATI